MIKAEDLEPILTRSREGSILQADVEVLLRAAKELWVLKKLEEWSPREPAGLLEYE